METPIYELTPSQAQTIYDVLEEKGYAKRNSLEENLFNELKEFLGVKSE